MLFRNLQRLEGLKSNVHISFARNFNKIRNSPHLSPKLVKQERSFLTKRPKTGILLVSLTFLPPLIPTVHAKELANNVQQQIQDNVDELIKNETKTDENDENEIQQNSFTWRELWSLIKPNFLHFFISIMGSFAIAYLNIKIPICLGELTNELSKYVNTEFNPDDFLKSIKTPALNLIWSYVLQGAFTSMTITSLSTLGENIASELRNRLFKSIINQDIEFFDKRRNGEIFNVLTSDINEFKSSFKTFFAQGLRSFTQTIGCSISLYIISPKMSAFLCILVPNLVLVGSFIGHFLRNLSKACQQQTSKCSAMANEVISSIRTVKSCAMEEKEIEIYANEVEKLRRMNLELGTGISMFQGLSNIGLNSIVLSCLIYGGSLLSNGEIKPGDLMSFLVASQTIQRSLASMSLMTGHYIKYINTGNRIFDFINMQPQLVSPIIGARKLDPLIGEISFRKVQFSYPTRKEHKVFNNFNMRINPGTTLALVGHSGSGKTTIAQLIERFYDVDAGSVNIDGVNIKNLDLKWLRNENIGYINQEPSLFAATVMENIRYGCRNATDEQVKEAARLANAHDFIESFPKAYDTMIGERGVTISGGQRQRIAIAREILKNPKILILDEATSSLDQLTEQLVASALEKLMRGRTVLIIAHRLSTIQNADLIAVLSNGRICEMGNHDELLRQQGLYWQFIKEQKSE